MKIIPLILGILMYIGSGILFLFPFTITTTIDYGIDNVIYNFITMGGVFLCIGSLFILIYLNNRKDIKEFE